MKVELIKIETDGEESAVIRAARMTDAIRDAIVLLEGGTGTLPVIKEGQTYLLKTDAVYYIESVDKRTFVYTKEDCYESKSRLYELEEQLGGYFARCSKAAIVNMRKIAKVHSEIGGRMDATLLNGEVLLISRSYVKEIKRRLEI